MLRFHAGIIQKPTLQINFAIYEKPHIYMLTLDGVPAFRPECKYSLAIPTEFRQALSSMTSRPTFNGLMSSLAGSENQITSLPENETWEQMIQRVHVPGRLHAITEETYWYFLEVLPPKWMDRRYFAFAEGQEPLSIFWQQQNDFYCRRLTQEETDQFCEASGLSKHYGS